MPFESVSVTADNPAVARTDLTIKFLLEVFMLYQYEKLTNYYSLFYKKLRHANQDGIIIVHSDGAVAFLFLNGPVCI